MTTRPEHPDGLAEIAERYDTILCDVWGVIHNGRRAFAPACGALTKFREQGGTVVLITNAPVPKAQVISYFEPMGVSDDCYDDCVSSGDATREELSRRTHEKIWRLGVDAGWERDQFLYQGLGLNFVEPEAADTLLCVGLEDQANDDPEDYRGLLKTGVERGLPMICANPDIKVRVGDQLVWCAGALAAIYEEEGGTVIYPGKPHPVIYELALKRAAAARGKPSEAVLCIGDSPGTDMRGAARQGLDALYVGTGLADHGDDFEAEVGALLEEYETGARYAMAALRW
ncbi:TIGR01459 family HAD-type hydrolase [Henriciella aquimarina]|uniref:TIGR01459 family HAD-type hydrolase n=1 Tax=Henriciella aquimarina TaxID=545261 RepID=UPI0009FD97AA|nr:TIGR01459 family HAD-type hydrolase [Henriciella aquimarina]